MPGPNISVIIPVYNGADDLRLCLEHLSRSNLSPGEVLVVDDGSTDDSAETARRLGARVISSAGRGGPARARNAGALEAAGDVLFFIDADVCVQAGTLQRISNAFAQDASLAALIGSYDENPSSRDFLSQYKNLMHCYVHQQGNELAGTFWSGCGAIRREVFLAHSGFDSSYQRPAIEDIELGYRLVQSGCKIILDKSLQVTHLKRWGFWKLVKTDIFDRGIPWTELILRDQQMPDDLNLQLSQRVSVALAFLCFTGALLMATYWRGYFITPIFALLLFFLGRYWFDGGETVSANRKFAVMTVGIGVLLWLSFSHHMLGLIPPVLLGYLLLFMRHRYALGSERRRSVASAILVIYALVSVVIILAYLPGKLPIFLLFALLFLLVVLNNHFYLFLAARRGRAFAMAAIPFHLLYHFYNGISFGVGLVRHTFRSWTGRERAVNVK